MYCFAKEQAYLSYLRVTTLLAYRWGDWRAVPIHESKEPLAETPPELCSPYYAQTMGLTDDRRVFLREAVLERYLRARALLQRQGYDLLVYDGWRSFELQEKLFWYYMQAFTATRFNQKEQFAAHQSLKDVAEYFYTLPADLQAIMREANRTYVSWPSRDPGKPSPHITGGSIDVWLYQDGAPVNLGVPFDWMEVEAGAFYHCKIWRNRFPGNDRKVCQNRRRLLLAMATAGFTCYGPEIWHFNYGNQMHGLVTGKPAWYSHIEPTS